MDTSDPKGVKPFDVTEAKSFTKELSRLADAADKALEGVTEGDWIADYLDHNDQRVVKGPHIEVCTCWHHSVGSIEKEMEANARFIAYARQGVPALAASLRDAVAEIARKDERIAALEKALAFYANPEVYKPHPHGPAFDRRDLSFLAQSALEPSLPDDGSCVRCGSVPRNARGLCATCLDEDAVGAGEVNRLREALENLMNAGHAVTTLHSRWAPEEAEYYTCLLDGVNAARQIFNMEPII